MHPPAQPPRRPATHVTSQRPQGGARLPKIPYWRRTGVQVAISGAITLLLLIGAAAAYLFWPRANKTHPVEALPANMCSFVGRNYFASILPGGKLTHQTTNGTSLARGHCLAAKPSDAESIQLHVTRFGTIGDTPGEDFARESFDRYCRRYSDRWEQAADAPSAPAPKVGSEVCGRAGPLGSLAVLEGDLLLRLEISWPTDEAAEVPEIAEELARRTLDRLGSR